MKESLLSGLLCLFLFLGASGQKRVGMEHSVHDEITLRQCRLEITKLKASNNTIELAHHYRYAANYFYKGLNADSTLHYYRLALDQYETASDSFQIHYCRFRIGQTIALEEKGHAVALEWLLPSADYFEKINDHLLAAHAWYSVSEIYKFLSNDSLHSKFLLKAQAENEIARDTILILIFETDKTDDLIQKELWSEALLITRNIINLGKAININVFLKSGLLQKGMCLYHLRRYKEATEVLSECLGVSATQQQSHIEAHFYLALSHLHLGNRAESGMYMHWYKQLKEEEAKRKDLDNFEELFIQYELGKKEAAIASLENENMLKETISRQQQKYITGLAILLVILIIGVWFIINNEKKRRQLQEYIHQQQEEYAKNLQYEKEQKMFAEFNKQLAEVQLTALSAQMNPHFIFNCMNSIQKYILKNEKSKALDFLQHFSELIRDVLENSAKTKIALDEEIGMLDKYITLERLRSDEKFNYRIDVAHDLQTDFFEIPGMIIQPYIENAIWHGLLHKSEKGFLRVSFEKQNSSILCTVQDNGVGRAKAREMEESDKIRKGYGIPLSQKRLELLYQNMEDIPTVKIDDLMDDDHQPSGTKVTIHFHIEY